MAAGGGGFQQRNEGRTVKEKPTQNDKIYKAMQKLKKKMERDEAARKAANS